MRRGSVLWSMACPSTSTRSGKAPRAPTTAIGRSTSAATWARFAAARWLIALIVVPLTLTVLVVSLALPKSYRATAKIVKADAGGVFGSGDVESVKRRLATLQTLLTTPEVLDRAARRLPDESAETLEGKVESSVDGNSNIINVVGSDGDPRGAAAIANAVATAFLSIRRNEEQQQDDRARAKLLEALDQARGRPNSAARGSRDPAAPQRADRECGVCRPGAAARATGAAAGHGELAATRAEHDLRLLRSDVHRDPRRPRA